MVYNLGIVGPVGLDYSMNPLPEWTLDWFFLETVGEFPSESTYPYNVVFPLDRELFGLMNIEQICRRFQVTFPAWMDRRNGATNWDAVERAMLIGIIRRAVWMRGGGGRQVVCLSRVIRVGGIDGWYVYMIYALSFFWLHFGKYFYTWRVSFFDLLDEEWFIRVWTITMTMMKREVIFRWKT